MLPALANMAATGYLLAALSACPVPQKPATAIISPVTAPTQIINSTASLTGDRDTAMTLQTGTKGELGFRTTDISPALACYALDQFTLSIVVTPVVMINQKYTPNSCEYKALSVRGRREVADAMAAYNANLPMLQATLDTLAQGFTAPQPLTQGDILKLKDDFFKKANPVIDAKADELGKAVQSRLDAFYKQEAGKKISCEN